MPMTRTPSRPAASRDGMAGNPLLILDDTDSTPVLVSACLAGEACRYDAGATPHPLVLRLVEQGRAVPVCPEVLGGLSVPRDPIELLGGRAICRTGRDVTSEFRDGAQAALALARKHGCRRAILKARSPSCGCGTIYDGSFTGVLIPGDGMLASLLKLNGFCVCTELGLPEDAAP